MISLHHKKKWNQSNHTASSKQIAIKWRHYFSKCMEATKRPRKRSKLHKNSKSKATQRVLLTLGSYSNNRELARLHRQVFLTFRLHLRLGNYHLYHQVCLIYRHLLHLHRLWIVYPACHFLHLPHSVACCHPLLIKMLTLVQICHLLHPYPLYFHIKLLLHLICHLLLHLISLPLPQLNNKNLAAQKCQNYPSFQF